MSTVLNVLKNENMLGAITRLEDTISQCKNRMGGGTATAIYSSKTRLLEP